jgi:ribosomal protein S18 acetylase RimI-like enzyme
MSSERQSREAVLDNVVLTSLTGPHAPLAQGRGRAIRYRPGVAGFAALPDRPQAADWTALAELVGTGGTVALVGIDGDPPPNWTVTWRIRGVQMVGDDVAAREDADVVRLATDDVPEMLDLVAQTRPGPFFPQTIEMGTYLGIRQDGMLVAMAGERLHPPGWTEISAVATAPEFVRRGLATRLVHAVAHGIRQRGETPFLHVVASNTSAIRLYEKLGFRIRGEPEFLAVQAPSLYPTDP